MNIIKSDEFWIRGIDIYSTCLHNLNYIDLLNHLVSVQIKKNWKRKETWVIVANAFAAEGENQTAIESLNRAIQLDPDYSYAHYLVSHEYIKLKDYNKASLGFHKCVSINPFNYQ